MGVFSISMFNLREGILVTSPFQDHKKPHQTTGWTTKNSMLDQRTWDSNPLPVTVASKGSCHSFIGIPYKKMCKGLGGDCFWEGGHRKITWFFKHIRTMNLWAYKIACSFSSNTPPNKKIQTTVIHLPTKSHPTNIKEIPWWALCIHRGLDTLQLHRWFLKFCEDLAEKVSKKNVKWNDKHDISSVVAWWDHVWYKFCYGVYCLEVFCCGWCEGEMMFMRDVVESFQILCLPLFSWISSDYKFHQQHLHAYNSKSGFSKKEHIWDVDRLVDRIPIRWGAHKFEYPSRVYFWW